jgi:Interleukin-like EMT inducer
MRAFGRRDAGLVYGACLVGVVLVTWPLARDPAHLWPLHHDPPVFAWVMASLGERLLHHPLTLFHGNAFYPNGESLAYTELLLPPSLLGWPGFRAGYPVLTYNLLLLTLWPLNGLAMAWAAHGVTRSRPAAWLAALVFCLSPYFTEYYLEFQMLLAAMVPVGLYAWTRWLETGHRRWLAGALGALALQGLTTWYYTVILGLAFVTLTGAALCLRWRAWEWRHRLGWLALGSLGMTSVLLPAALPYLTVHREFGYERGIAETTVHYADLYTFVEAGGRSWLYDRLPMALSGHIAETSAFVGLTALALAVVSGSWRRRERRTPAAIAWVDRGVLAALGLTLAIALVAAVAGPLRGRLGSMRFVARTGSAFDVALFFGLVHLGIRGFIHYRGRRERRFGEADWVRCLAFLCAVSAVLALGPVVHLGRQSAGPGPYLGLYQFFLPLHVLRTTVRFAVVTVAGLALLAALGLRALEAGLAARPGWRRAVVGIAFAGLAVEYAVVPGQYERVSTDPRAVDLALRRDPDEVAVLEWPTNVAATDADAMVRSLVHGKLLVNGLSGFAPPSVGELSGLLSTPATPFPSPEARAALRRIYPLRYLVVRLDDPAVTAEWRPVWLALRREAPPPLRFVGSFGSEDLYRISSLPERGRVIERAVSFEFLRTHPRLRLGLRPLAEDAELGPRVEVRLNGRLLAERPLRETTAFTLSLGPPDRAAQPNVVTIAYRADRLRPADDARYRIGVTGVFAPGTLRVRSSGDPQNRVGSIELDGVELSPDGRGYNLVALDPGGRVVDRATFDTHGDPAASVVLATWVQGLTPGTIVAGAVRDEASGSLDARGIAALRSLGVAGDVRGRFRTAHAFVGVKGAPVGSAIEEVGGAEARATVGRLDLGLELTEFVLGSRTGAE